MKKSLLLVTVLFVLQARSQDHIYSQTFMSPLYLNPAAAGAADNDVRFNAIYRKQWIAAPGQMNYFTASVDKYVPNLSGGVGLIATGSDEGFIKKVNLAAMYSFEICNEDWELRLGMSAGVSNRRLDYSKLIFSDQLDNTGIIPGGATSADLAINNGRYYPDMGAGFLYFWKNSLMISGSAQHINTPDESFTSNTEAKLPIRFNLAARWMFETENWYILPSMGIYKQATNNAFNMGCEFKSQYINLGLYYRSNINFKGSNAFVVTLTLDNFIGRGGGHDKMRIGISHDATTGPLTFTRTAGSTEAAFEYQVLTDDALSAENRCRAGYSQRGSVKCYGNFW